jgi:hypothetical protein
MFTQDLLQCQRLTLWYVVLVQLIEIPLFLIMIQLATTGAAEN